MAGVLVCGLWLSGCASPPQLVALEQQWPSHLPEQVLLEQVPFLPQGDRLCGPASLAMVAQAAGKSVTQEQLTPMVYVPGREGALQLEMLAATRRLGLVGYPLEPRLDKLLSEVASGQPVLVLQNLGLSFAPSWHYAVLVGFDRAREEVVLHSGTTARLRMSMRTFEYTWARSEHWALRVSAPDHIPASAEAETWTRAVAALERVDPAAAHTAYAAALRRWPQDRISLLGLGNTAYAQGQLARAEGAYDMATRVHPDFADAWNNLAQVRLERGRLPLARQAIERALTLGGPRLNDYKALQQRLESRQP